MVEVVVVGWGAGRIDLVGMVPEVVEGHMEGPDRLAGQ